MTQTFELFPGITLRCFPDRRFKQGCLSFQIVRPMCAEEASLNALLPAVLLRGTEAHPDLRSITMRLDELYGASVGTMVRRVGDYQTTGLFCGFIEDRFAMPGDRVLEPMVDFLREILLQPVMEDGGFDRSFVESEKKNLISTIESERNDKRAYAMGQLVRSMCAADSYGVPRLGEVADVEKIDHRNLYDHYQKILRESRIDLFYVGSVPGEQVADLTRGILEGVRRSYISLPAHTAFHDAGKADLVEEMDVAQGNLCMGFVTPIGNTDEHFVAMQVMNTIFGGGMISKLFNNVREKLSLCYSIGSSYYGIKGLVTVAAGIDFDKEQQTKAEILRQLEACQKGEITDEELIAAKEALLSGLRSTHDAPGSIEGYYAVSALNAMGLSPAEYMEKVHAVRREQVVEAAKSLQLHSTYFLKGVNP